MKSVLKASGKTSTQSASLALVILWLLLTLALAVWWLIHGLRQIGAMSALEPAMSASLSAQYRMILSEGLTLIALLIVGGIGLLILLRREFRQGERLRTFFATFTHELKTPLAGLRLQAESLEEDLGPGKNPLVGRLLENAGRLELQLDNALFLATIRQTGDVESDPLHLEMLSLSPMVERAKNLFPDFQVELSEDAHVNADRRALESVLKNLIQNSRTHAGATQINIRPERVGDRVILDIRDNGGGFSGDIAQVGKLFFRHTPRSGSGIGLHLAKILIERMGGSFRVSAGPGFPVLIELAARGGA